jgi:hypothetical protein
MFYDWRYVERVQVLELLKQVRDLFTDPNKWVDWPIAVNAFGQEVSPCDVQTCVMWSLMGAIDMFSSHTHPKPLNGFVASAARDYLDDLSDNKLFKEMLSYDDEFALICLAVEELEEEESNVGST